MDKIELLLPAGDKESLRAAVANGADAVYLGLDSFNARRFADNFRRETLPSVVEFCHENRVRVYVTANILVKNRELEDYLNLVSAIGKSDADAIIIQDTWLIPLIRENAPNCEIHISTQATTNNRYAVPEGADRVIVPREMGFWQISEMTKAIPIEMFVHGALCLSYSGQCLFSSVAGGRSGNRGKCAQPCRHRYNDTYPLSTMDLCLLEKIPEIVKTGAVSMKVEGRMRGPLYTGTVARIYRKYIDMHYAGMFSIDPADLEELKMAFNREFTTGFAFNKSIVDSEFGMNRGLYLGTIERGSIRLEAELKAGDGVMALRDGKKSGNIVQKIRIQDVNVERAGPGETVTIQVKGARNGDRIYKTSSVDFRAKLGADFSMEDRDVSARPFKLPKFREEKVSGPPQLFVKVRNARDAAEAERSGASVIYYDIFAEDVAAVRESVRKARFFPATQRIMSDADIEKAVGIIRKIRPDGILAGERGLPAALEEKGIVADVHLGMSLNIFNDLDLEACGGIPIISPELNLTELEEFKSKRFAVMVHGPTVMMTTKEPIKDRVLRDESGRRFPTRKTGDLTEILNCSDLGMFNLTKSYLDAGIKWFYLEPARDVGKIVDVYRRIVSGEQFDDRKYRKGFTTGHFRRGVN